MHRVSSKPTKRRRCRVTFSLRTLLVVITLVAVWLGWQVHAIRRQMAAYHALLAIEKLPPDPPEPTANVTLDIGVSVTFSGTFMPARERELNLIQRTVADEEFEDFYRHGIVDLAGRACADADLRQLGELPNISALILSHTPVTDAGLEHLYALRYLRVVMLVDTKVTQEGIERLRKALPDCNVVGP